MRNIRSALDYLVWELVLAAKGVPNEKHAFPVCETPKAFEDSLRRKRLAELSEEMITEIEALQPYIEAVRHQDHPFWILERLCNINKHRRILLTKLRTGMRGKVPGSDQYAFLSHLRSQQPHPQLPGEFSLIHESEEMFPRPFRDPSSSGTPRTPAVEFL